MITNSQKELANYVKSTLSTAPAEVAQANVNWYPQWVKSSRLSIGDRIAWEDILYEVYAPVGDNLYPPNEVPAVFRRVWIEEWPEWIQPAGAHDAYAKDAKVTHNDKKWISDIDANTYEPGIFGWTEKNK